jgi:drug/metabolite transporter (DMT)-like permease
LWAAASLIFRRVGQHVSPLALNLYKGLIAILTLSTIVLLGQVERTDLGLRPILLLALSGAIGIGLADSAFFAALNRLGERRTLLMVETLAPPIAVLIAAIWLSEFLPASALIGIVIILAGVVWVIMERARSDSDQIKQRRSGIFYGLLAALGHAIGGVTARAALAGTDIHPLWGTLVSISGAVVLLLIWLPASKTPFLSAIPKNRSFSQPLVLATWLATVLGMLLHQFSVQRLPAGVVQTLLATSSLFVLPLLIARGEQVSFRAFFGALVAIAGLVLVFSSS